MPVFIHTISDGSQVFSCLSFLGKIHGEQILTIVTIKRVYKREVPNNNAIHHGSRQDLPFNWLRYILNEFHLRYIIELLVSIFVNKDPHIIPTYHQHASRLPRDYKPVLAENVSEPPSPPLDGVHAVFRQTAAKGRELHVEHLHSIKTKGQT